jgi:addiction module RelE/StbE family toxin
MPRLVWTPPALHDLRRLHDFLAEKNPSAAMRAAKAIRQHAKALSMHPEIGRPIEQMLPGFRELVIDFGQSAYVALYHSDGEQVHILAVRHGREIGY